MDPELPKRAAGRRAVVCIGGGAQQLPLIAAARAERLDVVVVDRDATVPGLRAADHPIVASTHDAERVIAELHALAPEVEFVGVVARTTGKALETAAAIATEFGLPGLTPEAVQIGTSKSALRDFCERHGFPMPSGERVEEGGATSLAPPLVVKPDYTVVGKRDVRRVDRAEDVRAAIDRAAQSSFNGIVEVEAYVDGIDVACVFHCARGRARALAVYDEVLGFAADGSVVPIAVRMPTALPPAGVDATRAIVQAFAAALPDVDAILILCARVTPSGEAHIIEVHADLGGDRIADELLPAADPHLEYFREVVRVACGARADASSTDLARVDERAHPALLFAARRRPVVHPATAADGHELLQRELSSHDELRVLPNGFEARRGARSIPRALLLIGGGELQLPCFAHARALGLDVVLTDANADCPGRAHAAAFHRVGGADVEGIVAVARRESARFRFVGVHCGADFGLASAAAVRAARDLPGPSVACVARALDKRAMLDTLRTAGLPLPRGATVRDADELRALVDELGLPVILKPAGGSGSRGVETVARADELDAAWQAARAVSASVVVEQLVEGTHIDVNGLFLPDGAFRGCGTMQRFFSPPPLHVPIACVQPSGLSDADEAHCYTLVERGARALGIERGPVKADVVWTHAGPVLLEIGPRFQGDVITGHLTELASGAAPLRAHFAALAGHAHPERFLASTHARVAGWRALYPDVAGRLQRVEGLEDALLTPGIVRGFVSLAPGARLRLPRDTTATAGFLWAVGESASDVHSALDDAAAHVRFIAEDARARELPAA